MMLNHGRSKHYGEKIDEILFIEDRKNKLKRDALKRLFIDKQVEENEKYKEKALPIYKKSRGVF
jgi:phage gp16-like protein